MSEHSLKAATETFVAQAEAIREGGGSKGIERQHRHGRLTARERIERLADPGLPSLECGLFTAWDMYQEYGGAPAAGRL